MTFTVERPTPGRAYQSHGVTRGLWSALPFSVEVTDPEPRTDYAASCQCRQVYRITDDGVSWLRRRSLLRRDVLEQINTHGKNPALCACMGTVD